MDAKNTEFKPGMLVAYVAKHQGTVTRVICIATVKTVGKRDIKLTDSFIRFQLSGQSWNGLDYNRWIMPLTYDLHRKAMMDGSVPGLALIPQGTVLPGTPS